ncbi:MAG TPA: DUF1330 domain-containing protein [Pseudonocardiaceae bacterium]|jgi:uncharacterized protein (DUF1330 family)
MAKGYWVSAYREIHDPAKLAAYAQLAAPAIAASGGQFLVRNGQVEAHEAGLAMRTVIVEFDSFAAAVAAHGTPAYQEALAVLADGVERDFRIVEGT